MEGSLNAYVISAIPPKDYWKKVFPTISFTSAEPQVKSPFRSDNHPSMTVNPETGAWYDHGSKESGKSIVSFHTKLKGVSTQEALVDLFHTFIHPVIDDKTVRRWRRLLHGTPSFLSYIQQDRLVSRTVIDQFSLGSTGERISIPVANEFGLVTSARLYRPGGRPKIIHYSNKNEERSYGSPTMFFPLSVFKYFDDGEPIFLCEGEWDALALISLGLAAISTTNGCRSWAKQYNEMFRNRIVAVCYDNDQEGQSSIKTVYNELKMIARVVKRVVIPTEVGKDVTDWLRARPKTRSRDFWLSLVSRSQSLVDNPEGLVAPQSQVEIVPLDRASEAQYYNKRIMVDALVTGKGVAPYIVPTRYRVSCSHECDICPLAEKGLPHREAKLDPTKPGTLEVLDQSNASVERVLIKQCGLPITAKCRPKVTVTETANIERLVLIPALDNRSRQYVMRPGYYAGHGLKSNNTYRLTGITTNDPTTQESTHLFSNASPVQNQVETFELTNDTKRSLARFKSGRSTRAVINKLMEIAAWQSSHITRIRERADLHIVVDLAFHSVKGFEFNAEVVPRGMLDILVMGDTRTGKGFVAQGLVTYYNLGEVASGENCSFAGLVGGCESINKRFIVKWGLIPLNNDRLVVIDEASALSEQDFGKLSRVRSEGVAEISKIVREQTNASTRLVWLANPRSGRPIRSYTTGVLAIKELVGANEDVSRFDLVLTVASSEVSPEVINRVADGTTMDPSAYPADVCRSLVLWAWSRDPSQVVFSPAATSRVIDEAIKLGQSYSPVIPLVQAENVRFKIAKIAAAIAARLYSTDETGERLVVDDCHVEAACWLIRLCYNKPSMGYDIYSRTTHDRTTLTDIARVEKIFEGLNELGAPTIQGLLQLNQVTGEALADFVGDILVAKDIIGQLVQAKCIVRNERGGWYSKNQGFNEWLRTKGDSK